MEPQEKCMSFVMTQGIASQLDPLRVILYAALVGELFAVVPVDMFEFEFDEPTKNMTVSLQGYVFDTNELIEDVIVQQIPSEPFSRFWCKIDDYGDHYVATFLLPEEY